MPKRTGNAHVTSRRVSTSSGRTLRRTTLTHLCGIHRQWLLLGKILRLVHGVTCGAWAPKNLPWGRGTRAVSFFCTEEKHKNRNTDYTCFLHMANSVRPCLPRGGLCFFFVPCCNTFRQDGRQEANERHISANHNEHKGSSPAPM